MMVFPSINSGQALGEALAVPRARVGSKGVTISLCSANSFRGQEPGFYVKVR
jgi:hypothetical protein